MSACPHKRIEDCPLYVAAHDPDLVALSCIDTRHEAACAVARGANYADLLGRATAGAFAIARKKLGIDDGRHVAQGAVNP